jgi:hypothetical protein
MKLRYVFSAPSMLKLQPCSMSKETPEHYALFSALVKDCVEQVKGDVRNLVDGIELEVDILYNAYVESDFGRHILANDRFGFSKMYADSGGLQIVTQGKQVTDALKKQIYRDQCEADFAMCFDEIPTRSIVKTSGASSRSQTSDKMYFQNESAQCAIKTAANIKEQCEIIGGINDTTNVMYIVQGNTHQDMYEWFDQGTNVLKDWSRIGGLALADTCMGNGVLESVDMFIAYNRIRSKFGEELTKNHIHLLGVGSVNRLLPMLWVKDTLLPKDITVSFDSTSFSMTYMMGKFNTPDGKLVKKKDWSKYMSMVIDYFMPSILRNYGKFDKEVWVKHIMDNIMSSADTINKSPDGMTNVGQAHVTATIMYQLFSFCALLSAAIKDIATSNSPLSQLKHANDYTDAVKWRQQYGKYIPSARIQRSPEVVLQFE